MNKKEITVDRPVVWVTGASRGIGREIAKQFALIGCRVCLSARNKKLLQSAVSEITALGGSAHSFPLDIIDPRAVKRIYRMIAAKFGRVDVLVNNAGISSFKTFVDTTMNDFREIISTNLVGQVGCVKEVLPAMIQDKKGWIFNIISMAAVRTYEGSSAYSASKAGMLGFSRVLREEMKSNNIRVVGVIPGATDTAIWHPKIREKYSHRMMKAKSVAEAVLSVYQMPHDLVVDEIIFRPVRGELS